MTRAHQGRDIAGRTTRIDACSTPPGGQPGKRTLVETIAPAHHHPTQSVGKELAVAPTVGGSTTAAVQAKRPIPSGGHLVGPELAHPRITAGTGGQPLTEPVRSKMEDAFQADFSTVRIFQDGQAAELGAEAFTRGEHIHFLPGRYDPESASGLQLLGHELAHVIQQRAGRVAAPADGGVVNTASDLEAEADRQGERAARGAMVSATGPTATPGSLGRADDPVQLRTSFTPDQLRALRFGQHSCWYYISAETTPHVSFYLDDESHRYLDRQSVQRPQSSRQTADLSTHHGNLMYDELHVKLGNARYCFYADDGTPRSKSQGPGQRDSIPFTERKSWSFANSFLAQYARDHMGGVWTVWDLNTKFNAIARPLLRLPEAPPRERSEEDAHASAIKRKRAAEALRGRSNTFMTPRFVKRAGDSTTRGSEGDIDARVGMPLATPAAPTVPSLSLPPAVPSPLAVPPRPAAASGLGVADLYGAMWTPPKPSSWGATAPGAGDPSPGASERPGASPSAQGSAKRARHEPSAAISDHGEDRGEKEHEKERDDENEREEEGEE
jgi:hypothetical protein